MSPNQWHCPCIITCRTQLQQQCLSVMGQVQVAHDRAVSYRHRHMLNLLQHELACEQHQLALFTLPQTGVSVSMCMTIHRLQSSVIVHTLTPVWSAPPPGPNRCCSGACSAQNSHLSVRVCVCAYYTSGQEPTQECQSADHCHQGQACPLLGLGCPHQCLPAAKLLH